MITLVCGLPGSGKSTWARKKQALEGGYVIDLDELIACMRGTGVHIRREAAGIYFAMGDIAWMIAKRLDGVGENVIIIRTAPGEDEYAACARKCARVVLDTPPEQCARRVQGRQDSISGAEFAQIQRRFARFMELHGHEFQRIVADGAGKML